MNDNEILNRFGEKKRNLIIGMVLFVSSGLAYIIYWQINGLSMPFLILGIVFLAIPFNIFYYTYWTCPKCRSFLGGSYNIDSCPNCKFIFNEDFQKDIKQTANINRKVKNYSSTNIEPVYEHVENFPKYENYDIYNLVEVYKRIDHQRHKKEILFIESEIRKKLNIDPIVSLSDPKVEDIFDDILINQKPLSPEEEENRDISKMLDRIQIFLTVLAVIIVIAVKVGYENDMLLKLAFGLFGIVLLSDFIESFYSTNIYAIWRQSINYKDDPGLFRLNQVLIVFLFLMIATVFVKLL